MESLGRKLAGRIIKPAVLQNTSTLLELDLDNKDIYKDPASLHVFIGFITKCVLNKLLNDGTITERDSMIFSNAANNYYRFAVEYIQAKFTLDRIDHSEIYDEFVDYQTLPDESFHKNGWEFEEAKVIEGHDGNGDEMCHYRIDILW